MHDVKTRHPVHVAVCICTYRRTHELSKLLKRLADQTLPPQIETRLTVVVADNDADSKVERLCSSFIRDHNLHLIYVAVPERGISQARNACLDHVPVETDFLAFIDDDEVPEPDWLMQLLLVQAATCADIVHGPVLPRYTESTPDWIKAGDFFTTPRTYRQYENGQEIHFAATGNCLIRFDILQKTGLRFDERLGLSGGEDKQFFRQLRQSGYRIVWAAHAVVKERIPQERARLGYLLRSEFRKGNVRLPIKYRLKGQGEKNKVQLTLKTFHRSLATIASGIMIMLRAPFRTADRVPDWVTGALRVAEGLGMLSSVFGYRHQHYR